MSGTPFTVATITLQCGSCSTDVPFPASFTEGAALLPGADPATHDGSGMHAADITHAWRHTPWCPRCGADEGEHTPDCPDADVEAGTAVCDRCGERFEWDAVALGACTCDESLCGECDEC